MRTDRQGTYALSRTHHYDISIHKHPFAHTHAREAVDDYSPLRAVESFSQGVLAFGDCIQDIGTDGDVRAERYLLPEGLDDDL